MSWGTVNMIIDTSGVSGMGYPRHRLQGAGPVYDADVAPGLLPRPLPKRPHDIRGALAFLEIFELALVHYGYPG